MPSDLFPELATPAVLVDHDRLERNLELASARAAEQRVALRPHIKTHRSLDIGRRQLALGAIGITCAKPSEAQVFVEGGFEDVRIAYPVIGEDKLALLHRLRRSARVSFCVDSRAGAHQASRLLEELDGPPMEVLIKVDVGYGRAGVLWDSDEAVALARQVESLPALLLVGILTHAGQAYSAPWEGETEQEANTRRASDERDRMLYLRKRLGQELSLSELEVSIGSTPTFWSFESSSTGDITEVRPGNYVFHDLTQEALGVCQLDDCALSVLATVVSRKVKGDPGPQQRVQLLVDAGKKTLTPDRRYGQDGYGLLLSRWGEEEQTAMPDTLVTALSEEHGWVEAPLDCPLQVGDRVRIAVNHSCLVASTQDVLFEVSGLEVLGEVSVDARGRST